MVEAVFIAFLLGLIVGWVTHWLITYVVPFVGWADRLYQLIHRVPDCTPGSCFCRRTCIEFVRDEVRRG